MEKLNSILLVQDTKQTIQQRHRNILYLISQYLCDYGLRKTLNELSNEANLMSHYHVCDNIDLDTIYLDYCNYYAMKFGKQPKILKCNTTNVDVKDDTKIKMKLIKGKMKSIDEKREMIKEKNTELVMTGESINGLMKPIQFIEHTEPINFQVNFSIELQDLADIVER